MKIFLVTTLVIMFAFQVSAQITPFTMTLEGLDQTCAGNGRIAIEVEGTQSGASFDFIVYQQPNLATPFTTLANRLATDSIFLDTVFTLPAGDYVVEAIQTFGLETNGQSENTTVADAVALLEYTTTLFHNCDGWTVTVNVTQGNPELYELYDSGNNLIRGPQTSNVLNKCIEKNAWKKIVDNDLGDSVSNIDQNLNSITADDLNSEREEWIQATISNFRKTGPSPNKTYIERSIVDLEDFFQISYRVNGDGYIKMASGDWIYLIAQSSHKNEAIGDITLAIDNHSNIWVNEGHVCGGIIHFVTHKKLKVQSVDDFIQNFKSDTDDRPWILIDDYYNNFTYEKFN